MKAQIGCICVVLLSLTNSASAQGKFEKEKIRIGYAARVVAHSIPYLAAQAGLFREEGLQVEVVQTAGTVAPMALIAGEVDFSIMSAFLLIPVSVQGGDVIMLGAFGRYATMTLISRSEIRTAEELKGKIVGLQRPGDATEINARFALRHLGLDPSRDVSFLYLGSNELMWPALQTKKVAATVLQPPWTLLARKSGMNFLVDLSGLKIEYQGSTLASRRLFIRDNPNLTRRVLRAIARGVYFFYSRKEETLRILAKFLATDNVEALEEGYRYAKFPAKPYATESAVQATLNHLAERDPRFAQRKPAEFIESGPLAELDRSGFIDRLYAQK
jgi:ABC-type nitrate/sulfonate/bicarbonate transport system substrate-binding protein